MLIIIKYVEVQIFTHPQRLIFVAFVIFGQDNTFSLGEQQLKKIVLWWHEIHNWLGLAAKHDKHLPLIVYFKDDKIFLEASNQE